MTELSALLPCIPSSGADAQLAGMERTSSRSVTRGRAGGGAGLSLAACTGGGKPQVMCAREDGTSETRNGSPSEGKRWRRIRKGKTGRKHREREVGRDSDSKENKKGQQMRRNKIRKQHDPKTARACVPRLCKNSVFLLHTLEKYGAGEGHSFLLSVINYSVALNKNQLFMGKPDRVSFNLMFAEPSLLSHLPDVEHMLGSE